MALFSAAADAMAVNISSLQTLLEADQIASRTLTVRQWSIEFDGVTASNVPVRVQLCQVTATSAVGTSVTPASMRMNQSAAAATAKKLPASEGTVTVLEEHRVPPTSGLLIQYPLGEEPWIIGAASTASGISIRALAGAAVNATATIEWDE